MHNFLWRKTEYHKILKALSWRTKGHLKPHQDVQKGIKLEDVATCGDAQL